MKAKGKEFADFKAHFTADDRGFGYIKIMVKGIKGSYQRQLVHKGECWVTE